MNYADTCSHCGHQITAYTLPMNEGLITAFLKFVEVRTKLKRPVKKGELGLTNSQYGNFQNLRHFYLIVQPAGKGGVWEMTPTGWMFYRGQTTILTPAGHLGGATLEDGHLAWSTHKPSRKEITIYDVLPSEYKQRAEFKQEKQGAA